MRAKHFFKDNANSWWLLRGKLRDLIPEFQNSYRSCEWSWTHVDSGVLQISYWHWNLLQSHTGVRISHKPTLVLILTPYRFYNWSWHHTVHGIDPDPIPGLELIFTLYWCWSWSQAHTDTCSISVLKQVLFSGPDTAPILIRAPKIVPASVLVMELSNLVVFIFRFFCIGESRRIGRQLGRLNKVPVLGYSLVWTVSLSKDWLSSLSQ